MDAKLVALATGRTENRILLVEEPPRHGKSEHVSHYLPVWHVANWPDEMVATISYADDFAKSWGRKARETFLECAGDFGLQVDRRRDSAHEWGPLGYRGGMLTAGRGGPLTGRGFRLIVVDDPIKNSEEAQSDTIKNQLWDWFRSTVWTRLEPGGSVVVMNTRWAADDLTGRILADPQFAPLVERVRLPAIAEENDPLGRAIGDPLWPERWPLADLERIRGPWPGDYWWQAMYQQRPTQHAHAEWPDEYFEDVYAARWPDGFELSVVAVDASEGKKRTSGDFGAIVFVGLCRGDLYVDADIERRPVPELVAATARMAAEHRPDEVCFEGNQFQKLIVGEFDRYVREVGMFPVPSDYIENYGVKKEVRIRRLGGRLKGKKFRFRRGRPGIERLLSQLKSFPLGDHDDGPDALEQGVRRLNELAAAIMRGERTTRNMPPAAGLPIGGQEIDESLYGETELSETFDTAGVWQ